jgi:hypothetical protein
MHETAPRTDSNLWLVDVDPRSGLPSGPARRRTQWTDFRIYGLSASENGSALCFNKGSIQSNIYVGELRAHGTRLTQLHRLPGDQAVSYPLDWTPDSSVRVDWLNCLAVKSGCGHEYFSGDLAIRILQRVKSGLPPKALGATITGNPALFALIAYDRVAALREHDAPTFSILGKVLAHEIAHLL